MNISWYNSIPVLKNGIRNTVFYSVTNRKPVYFSKVRWTIWDLRGKFKQKRIHLFRAFRSLSFKFVFKRGNYEEHPKSKCGWISALHNSLLYAGIRYLLWRYRNLSLAFFFFRTFEAIASPLDLESSWQPRYSTVSCCLMAKGK